MPKNWVSSYVSHMVCGFVFAKNHRNKRTNTKKPNGSCRIDKFMNDQFHKISFLFNFYLFVYLFIRFQVFFFANEVICLNVPYRFRFQIWFFDYSTHWIQIRALKSHVRYQWDSDSVFIVYFTLTFENCIVI